jgi:hypothetical protein
MHEAPKRIPSITTESDKSDSANEAALRVTNTTLAVGITSEEEEEKYTAKLLKGQTSISRHSGAVNEHF